MTKKNRYGGKSVAPLSAPENLPIRIQSRTPIKSALLSLVACAAFALVALNVNSMVPGHLLGSYEAIARQVLPLLIGAYAARWGLRGLSRWLRRTEITVDATQVCVANRFGPWTHTWREPLSGYEGVRWQRYAIHESQRENASDMRTRYRHVIELVHPQVKKTVPLFVRETGRANVRDTLALAKKAFAAKNASDAERAQLEAEAERLGEQASGGNPRAQWEGFAALLGLPAIDARDGAHEVRAADELDQSLAERAQAGKVAADWQGDAPPDSLGVTREGSPDDPASQTLQITLYAGFMPTAFYYIFGGVAVLLLILAVVKLQFGALIGAIVFGGIGPGIWYLQRKNPRSLTVTRDVIQYKDPMVSSRSFSMALADIESVQIRNRDTESAGARHTGKLSGKQLLISSDQQERAVAGGLPDDGLEWLRVYLVTAVANA